MNACLVVSTLAPITKSEITLCLGSLLDVAAFFKKFHAVRDEVLREFLTACRLFAATRPTRQSTGPQQYFRLRCIVEFVEPWRDRTVGPKICECLTGLIVSARLLQFLRQFAAKYCQFRTTGDIALFANFCKFSR